MSRSRSQAREQALKLWIKSGKEKKPAQIATEIGVSPEMVRKWKSLDQWDSIPIKPKRRGAPEGNKNAAGNSGGSGAPEGNDFALKTGFFARIFPEDVLAIAEEIEMKEPIDILWDNIVIQYTAIARAQKIMYVADQQDETKVVKKEKMTTSRGKDKGEDDTDIVEFEWEYQHAWDKQASFMKAQSSAMSTLQSLVRRYEEMLNRGLGDEEQRLRIAKLKKQVDAMGGPDNTKRKLESFL